MRLRLGSFLVLVCKVKFVSEHCVADMILCIQQTFLISDAQKSEFVLRAQTQPPGPTGALRGWYAFGGPFQFNRFDKGICKFSIERCPKQWHSGGLLGCPVTKSFQILKGSGSSMILNILNEHSRWSTREISCLRFFPVFFVCMPSPLWDINTGNVLVQIVPCFFTVEAPASTCE